MAVSCVGAMSTSVGFFYVNCVWSMVWFMTQSIMTMGSSMLAPLEPSMPVNKKLYFLATKFTYYMYAATTALELLVGRALYRF